MSKQSALIGWPKYDLKRHRFAVSNAVWEHKLKPVDFVIFSYLCYCQSRGLVNTLTLEIVAKGIHMATATVKKYLSTLVSKGLVTGEPSSYLDKRGMKWKGNNLYTLLSVRVAVDKFNQRQLTAARQKAQTRQSRRCTPQEPLLLTEQPTAPTAV